MENAKTTKAKATRVNVYTIHTNKYIEQIPNKPTTTSMRNRHTQALAIEFSRSRTFYFGNVLQRKRAWSRIANSSVEQAVIVVSVKCEQWHKSSEHNEEFN